MARETGIYGLVKVGKDDVPADAPIRDLRWEPNGYYRSDQYSAYIHGEGLRGLKELGIEIVSDLEGYSKDDLRALSGIGKVTAKRLVTAAEQAEVDVRGTGWPWDVEVEVSAPRDIISLLENTDEKDVRQAIQEFLIQNDFFDVLETMILDAKRRELQERRESIERELEELEGGTS